MEAAMTAIELTGTVDEDRRLRLDEALPVTGPMRVRVIVLYPLSDLEEDIYTLEDGVPFHDEE